MQRKRQIYRFLYLLSPGWEIYNRANDIGPIDRHIYKGVAKMHIHYKILA